MKWLIVLVLIAGARSAYPHQDESTIVSLPEASVNPEKGPVDPLPINSKEDVFSPVYPGTEPYSPEKIAIDPEIGAFNSFNPEKGPVDPGTDADDPEKGPFSVPNVPVPNDDSEDIPIPQEDPKPESDLKTDATFWWPFYRSSWVYPTYRSYPYPWRYPSYRYYRPRTYYYRNYYW